MLPKFEYSIIDIELKSQKKKVKFRPILVKDEKLLLIAKEGQNDTDIFTGIACFKLIYEAFGGVEEAPVIPVSRRVIGDEVGITAPIYCLNGQQHFAIVAGGYAEIICIAGRQFVVGISNHFIAKFNGFIQLFPIHIQLTQ